MRLQQFGIPVIIGLFIAAFFSSCEKKEVPVVLPPKGTASHARVDMGEDYLTQIYFNFESGQVVKTSDLFSWGASHLES